MAQRTLIDKTIAGHVRPDSWEQRIEDNFTELFQASNSMPIASTVVPAGYCQIFSGYLEIVYPNYCDVQTTGILEII